MSVESSNHDGSDLATCRDLCANDPLCLSFHHSQGDLQCRLSTSDGSTSGCDACQFYTKHCLPGKQMQCINQTFNFDKIPLIVFFYKLNPHNLKVSETTVIIGVEILAICGIFLINCKLAKLITLTYIYRCFFFKINLAFVGK